jgi:hypothetical protein
LFDAVYVPAALELLKEFIRGLQILVLLRKVLEFFGINVWLGIFVYLKF